MPAINVARTDTFEVQRQKINQIGDILSNISAGGSDLQTGNLKLGDGTRSTPSLSFINDSTLGLYRPEDKNIEFVSSGKKLFKIGSESLVSFKNFVLQKSVVSTSGSSLLTSGSGYDSGTYQELSLLGGTGSLATVTITVENFTGSVTNNGSGYSSGSFAGVPLLGGTGTGTLGAFSVDGVDGTILDNGTGYGDGNTTFYDDIPLTNGSGNGAQAALFVDTTSGEITSVTISNSGSGYVTGDILSVNPNFDGVGGGSGFQYEITTNPGVVKDFEVNPKGEGYSAGDTLSLIGNTTGVTTTLDDQTNSIPVSAAAIASIVPDSTVVQTSGTGQLDVDTTVSSVDAVTNTITLSANPLVAGTATLSFIPPYGTPTTAFSYLIDSIGPVTEYNIVDGGNGYSNDDILSVSATDLVQPITYNVSAVDVEIITFVESISAGYFSVGDSIDNGLLTGEIYEVRTNGGNLDSLVILSLGLNSTDVVTKAGDSINYTIDTVSSGFRYLIDTGSGSQYLPDLNLYVGNTYVFDLSDGSNSSHEFALSGFRDGTFSPSFITGVSTTLSTSSDLITVASTTNIFVGMQVSVEFGDGDGSLPIPCTVLDVVDSTTIQLDSFPTGSGEVSLQFQGVDYTDGVTSSDASLTISVTENTPTLYYYCKIHPDMGGDDGNESVITIDPNNPKVFGSGFQIRIDEVLSTDIINYNVTTGEIEGDLLTTRDINSDTATIDTVTSNSVETSSLTTPLINNQGSIGITANSGTIILNSNTSIGQFLSIESSSGNITTGGELNVSGEIDVNSTLFINDNVISTTSGVDLQFQPATGRIVEVLGTSAFAIPSGNTSERPNPPAGEGDGYIRFNSETNQYEGYSDTNQTWSSLGGVRDLDGNTTILAEESVGANDNTLWFINDNINTLKVSPSHLEFVNVKRVKSPNLSAPSYTTWIANEIVALGDYIKYRNSIYEVTSIPTLPTIPRLATSGGEPTHTSGSATNGNVTLTYFTTAVSSLTFEEISEVRIDPLGFTDLVVNGELRFSNNEISSTTNDIIIKPTGSQKVVIQGTSSLVVPVGDNNSKGNPAQGSIRYSTTDSQFEGFNGSQWGGLGGVKDVDQDTRIDAETSPGNDEDILYFFNAGNNTLRLTTTGLLFDAIDTIGSVGSGNLNLDASLVTFNNLETSIDNSSSTVTKISSTKDNLDFALSSGIYNDHLLRLSDTGDVIYNLGFGTGTPNNVTVLNNTLTNFELKHTKVNTSRLELEKGTTGSGNAVVYAPSTESSAKVFVTAHNITTGDKEIIEYFVTNNGTDIFFTDSNNIKTGEELFSSVFDFDPVNNVRISITLGSGLTVGDQVELTIIKTITKR